MNKQAKHTYEFGPFHLDANEREVLRDGVPGPHAKSDRDVDCPGSRQRHIVEKDALMRQVRPDAIVEEGLTRNV